MRTRWCGWALPTPWPKSVLRRRRRYRPYARQPRIGRRLSAMRRRMPREGYKVGGEETPEQRSASQVRDWRPSLTASWQSGDSCSQRMTNVEGGMSKECRSPNDEGAAATVELVTDARELPDQLAKLGCV